MESNWASEHLQTIRTLMERSAVYRRALAPIMLAVGILGLGVAALGITLHLDAFVPFVGLWLGTAVVAVGGAFLIARWQALKENEPFWSPPTRRVAQAVAPAFVAGFVVSLLLLDLNIIEMEPIFVLVNVFFYACAIHAAGFFMPRGIRLFAWVILALAAASAVAFSFLHDHLPPIPVLSHALMGLFFGVLHLAYAIYLYLTEKRKNAA